MAEAAKTKKKKPQKAVEDQRGEYRPIYTVLIHGPDYQALSPMEKLVFLHLKLNLGPAGIGILYATALADQTGHSEDQIRLAIDILSARGWVAHERNVFWVVEGLKYEPSLTKANDNHRLWLARHLRGLPKLNVVKHFCDRYREWLPGDWQWDLDGIPKPIPITSTITTTTTKTTTEKKKPSASGEAGIQVSRGWPAEAATLWGAKVAPIPVGRIGAQLKASVDALGWPKIREGMEAYIFATPDGRWNLQQYANNVNFWIEKADGHPRLANGDFSMTDERGDDSPLGKMVIANMRKSA